MAHMPNNDPHTTEVDGLVFAYDLDGNGGCRQLTQLDEILAAHKGVDRWIHLQSDAQQTHSMLHDLGVPELAIEAMTTIETRPRVINIDTGILMVLRGVNTSAGAEPEDLASLRIWLTDELIVTARKSARKLMSAQDVRAQLVDGIGPHDTGGVLINIIDRLVEYIGRVVDDLDDETTRIEDHVLGAHAESRAPLNHIRRAAAQLKRYLAPQRDALDGLFRLRGALTDEQAFDLRELTDRTTRYVEDLDLTRERTQLLTEESRNQIAEMQNKRMYVLSLVTAIFLPLSFLTGVFGMNVMGLPGVEDPAGFVLVAGGMGLLAAIVMTWMKLGKWF